MYFDYAATSIKRQDVIDKLIKNIDEYQANPASIHGLGKKAKRHLEDARKIIANHIGTKADKVYFTSGATESNNSLLAHFDRKSYEIISTNIEHKSVLEPLERMKAKIIYLEADSQGLVSLEDLKSSITNEIKLVVVMYVNNETGVIQPIKEIGQYLKDKDIWFHVDAVQALGHIDIDVEELGVDSMSLSGHKIGGLNGFGALYLRHPISPLISGGGQEKGQRAGTSNVLGAKSMAMALEAIQEERDHVRDLKAYFLDKLKCVEYQVNGSLEKSVDHIANIYFPFVKSDLLLTYLDMRGVYLSAGSACNSNTLEPSYVIEKMYDKERAKHSLRFSFGFTNTREEIDQMVSYIYEMYERKKK